MNKSEAYTIQIRHYATQVGIPALYAQYLRSRSASAYGCGEYDIQLDIIEALRKVGNLMKIPIYGWEEQASWLSGGVPPPDSYEGEHATRLRNAAEQWFMLLALRAGVRDVGHSTRVNGYVSAFAGKAEFSLVQGRITVHAQGVDACPEGGEWVWHADDGYIRYCIQSNPF